MEDGWEEEEQLVVVELSGVINADFLSKGQGTCKILDIDSERPLMQVGPYVFTGEYEEALGTCVVFQEEQSSSGRQNRTSSGSRDSASPELKYKCHTVKKLMMQRTFLAEKKESVASGGMNIQSDGDGIPAESAPPSSQAPENTGRLQNSRETNTAEADSSQDGEREDITDNRPVT